MSYRTVTDIMAEAEARNLRRALFVTALPIEMRAVRAHLTDLGSCAGRDGTIYECGVFSSLGQEWLVVVAETGAGTHPAQSVVTYAHATFGPFETQIFVGVGGSRKSEAPVGCVVASDHVYMPYSGK
jgi:nucleoside phosphorylase